jgi:glycosyltransferase involved in cell wall biosynthesis
MKLLIFYETVYPDFIGGVELRNYEVAAALCRRGHEVTLAGFCRGSLTTDLANLRMLPLGALDSLYNSAGKRSTRQALRCAATAARLDLAAYDLVETPNMPYIHLVPLAMKCAAAGKPLLVAWYEYWGPYWRDYVGTLKAPVYRAIEWLTAQLGTEVNATSELTRARVAAARRRGSVDLVPCGISVGRVQAAAETGQGVGGPPLIYAGRLLEHKRLDLALRAVALLARQAGGAGTAESAAADMGAAAGGPLFTIFGEGPDRPRLEALTAELGLAGRVLFRGHVETSEEVWRELGAARLALQPSAREGFGLFPLEAMAAGLPVVYCQSSESAVDELVRDGIEGAAAAADPDDLAAILARLLADTPAATAEHRRLAANARTRAALYDWDAIGQRIEEICLRLLAARR